MSKIRTPDKPNIILIGFSTTGKSTAGRQLAERLGWAFVDTDAWIVGMAGKPIAEIFVEEGEAHFRELERQGVEEALTRQRTVVATGGGAVLSAANRRLMMERGRIILLEAQPETILRRMQADDPRRGAPVRPLLAGPNPLQRIIQLKKERQAIYEALADEIIHTDHQSIADVVDHLLATVIHLRSGDT